MELNKSKIIAAKVGLYSSLILTVLTLLAFGFGMMAVPPAGPFCPGDCMSYPFEQILDYYPRDYYWMYIAVFQLMVYVIFTVSIHYNAPAERRIFSATGTAFALISATVLLSDYFIQFAVIPISLMKGETEGIAILTQYNGHGIFIVLEELGYILMSLAFLFKAFAFPQENKLEKSIRWIMILPVAVTVVSFLLFTLRFGLDRHYRFEVVTLSANWLVLIAAGIILSIYFRKNLNKE
jgi:hypothetical protein